MSFLPLLNISFFSSKNNFISTFQFPFFLNIQKSFVIYGCFFFFPFFEETIKRFLKIGFEHTEFLQTPA